MPFDVTQPAEVDAGFAKTEESLGPVDVLVNNAGVPQNMKIAAFRETEPEEWDAYIQVNLYGVLHCSRRVVDGMCDRGWGRIITISSDAGTAGLALGVSLYGAGKAAALGFMRHLAMEVARQGVTANSVALGFVPPDGPGELDYLTRGIPVGRGGTPDDVGSLVAYLASEEAAWMTGQTLHLDGGSITT
jgi:NAD(P)-dependent dehydrogenase (short-subunit alcohol dehydrogenase family)